MNNPQTRCRLRTWLSLLLLIFWPSASALALSGACVDCHTMHNSQGGSAMTFDNATTAGSMLLKGTSCGGCHADATANTGSTMPGAVLGRIPQVDISVAGNILAGGSFDWVMGGDSDADTKGHNVKDLGIAPDSSLGATPPGFDSSTAHGVGTFSSSNQLTCAGTYGCHGSHLVANKFSALEKAHHSNAGNDGATVLGGSSATVGGSYRFLKTIQGIEIDGGWLEASDNHNVYFGSVSDTDTTISALCAQCHGDYHQKSDIGTASPWLRHPSDFDMKALTGEFDSYVYTIEAPVAASSLGSMSSAATTSDYSTHMVTCLSCHRAHGSPYYKLLRWDYPSSIAGCAYCHTSKS